MDIEQVHQIHELQHSRATWEQMLAQAMELTWPKPSGRLPPSTVKELVADAVEIADALYEAVEKRWPAVPRCSCPRDDEDED